MNIVHVHINIKLEFLYDFIIATVENAKNSLLENGVLRFDLIQQLDDPSQFILIEVYRDETDAVLHKQTIHYAKWRDTVAPMMQEPRWSKKYSNIFPTDEN